MGIDDQRYAAVLEGLVKAGKAKGDVLTQIREKGVDGMQVANEKVVGDSVFGGSLKDVDSVVIARERIIEEILKAQH